MLSDKIKSAKRQILTVPVPQWGFDVYLRRLTLAEIGSLQTKLKAAEQTPEDLSYIGEVLVTVLCEEDGTPCFDATQVPLLLEKDGSALLLLFREAMKLNALDVDEQKKS